jgi:F420H(2)-dependent quinone reductase
MIPAVSQEDTFAVPSIVNTIAIRILRSPLNGLLSHNTLLLSFQGCKSGKTYTIPLRYAQEADTVLCFTHRGNTWWKNLRGDTPVTVDLKGRSLPGIASAVTDDQTMIEHEMYTFLLQLPGDATYKGVRLTPDGTPNRTDIARSARSAVLVQIRLKA